MLTACGFSVDVKFYPAFAFGQFDIQEGDGDVFLGHDEEIY
jgi:hypothetical protein